MKTKQDIIIAIFGLEIVHAAWMKTAATLARIDDPEVHDQLDAVHDQLDAVHDSINALTRTLRARFRAA